MKKLPPSEKKKLLRQVIAIHEMFGMNNNLYENPLAKQTISLTMSQNPKLVLKHLREQ